MTLTVNAGTPAADTPTMPQWALIFLGTILFAVAIRSMPVMRRT
jgi:hypothetical protein